MTNFTVLTDEKAAHDAATSKRYLEALREVQADNARLRAHIKQCADLHTKAARDTSNSVEIHNHKFLTRHHLAALGETK